MHELALMQDMVEAVDARVREAGRTRARRVVLEVGRVSGALPDALRFCFEACSGGSAAEGAELEIRELPGLARCLRCGNSLALDVPYGLCDCGSAELEWLSGRELRVRELEVI